MTVRLCTGEDSYEETNTVKHRHGSDTGKHTLGGTHEGLGVSLQLSSNNSDVSINC